MKPNIVIVGAGLIGLLTARELVRAGLAVTVLERGESGRESSWAGGGILSPLYPWRYPDPVNVLAAWSQRHYRELCGRLAADTGCDPEWTRSGLLMPSLDQAERARAQAWAARFGADLQALEAAAAAACEPALAQPMPALWLPAIAQVRNPRLLQALRRDVEQRGAVIREGCSVHGLRLAGERVVGLDTPDGPLTAERVVVCSGAWSGDLLRDSGLSLPVEPVRGQMLLFRAEPGVVSRIVLAGERYIIPRRDGRVLVGSTMERTGYEKATTDSAREAFLADVRRLLPRLAEYPIETHWAGLRPGSPQGVPFVGPHPRIGGLYVNAGHFRNGVVMGLASARLLADTLLERAPIVEPAPYAPPA